MSPPYCRSYMRASMSRMIGKAISVSVCSRSGIGPTVIIWCTAGVSGIAAPAIRAIRGLQTPQQTKTYSVSIVPLSVCTRRTRPFSTSIPITSVLGGDRQRAEGLRRLAHQRAGSDRVDDADAGRVEAAEQDLLVDVRHELLHLRRRQQLRRLAPRDRRGEAPVQLLQALLAPRHLDPAAHCVDAELDVLVARSRASAR